MKKISAIIIVIITIVLLGGCGNSDKYPRISIEPTSWRIDHILLPLRENYKFAEVPYTIEETEEGYNIIIHCVKGE